MLNYAKRLELISFGDLPTICEKAGLNKNYLYHILSGDWNPKAETLRLICRVLNLRLSQYCRIIEELPPNPRFKSYYVKDLFIKNINHVECIFRYDYIHLAIKFFIIQKEISLYKLKREDKDYLHTFLSDRKNKLDADVTMYKLEHLASIIKVPLSALVFQIEYIAIFNHLMSKDITQDRIKSFSYFRSLDLI